MCNVGKKYINKTSRQIYVSSLILSKCRKRNELNSEPVTAGRRRLHATVITRNHGKTIKHNACTALKRLGRKLASGKMAKLTAGRGQFVFNYVYRCVRGSENRERSERRRRKEKPSRSGFYGRVEAEQSTESYDFCLAFGEASHLLRDL